MSILQVLWLTGSIIAALGLSAIAASMRSSQLSEALRRVARENARLRAQMSHGSIMEALREDGESDAR